MRAQNEFAYSSHNLVNWTYVDLLAMNICVAEVDILHARTLNIDYQLPMRMENQKGERKMTCTCLFFEVLARDNLHANMFPNNRKLTAIAQPQLNFDYPSNTMHWNGHRSARHI